MEITMDFYNFQRTFSEKLRIILLNIFKRQVGGGDEIRISNHIAILKPKVGGGDEINLCADNRFRDQFRDQSRAGDGKNDRNANGNKNGDNANAGDSSAADGKGKKKRKSKKKEFDYSSLDLFDDVDGNGECDYSFNMKC
jgi:hypothetical protein